MKKPLLTIIIPTYNRASLLEKALKSLLPQIKDLEDVELVVSDNASTDQTEEVVRQALQTGSFKYNRNNENMGAVGNIFTAIEEIATGEYCWVIGDDDMVRQGKVNKIVEIIKENKLIDYFFINYFTKQIKERDGIIDNFNSAYTPSLKECLSKDLTEKQLNNWEHLLGIDTDWASYLFTAIVSSIFRRTTWLQYSNCIQFDKIADNQFSRLDMTYPHLKIVAISMINKPVYYIGDPIVLLGQGSQEWSGHLPKILLLRLKDVIELYEEIGVSEEYLHIVRNHYLKQCGTVCFKLIEESNDPSHFKMVMDAMHLANDNKIFFNSFIEETRHFVQKLKTYQEYLFEMLVSTIIAYSDKDDISIAVWGSGEICRLLYTSSDNLARKVKVVIDNNKTLQGTVFQNKFIIRSPDYLKENHVDIIVIASIKYVDEIIDQIRNQLNINTRILSIKGFS
ncbi:glycosyltransferase family A protein [Paenibacillus validus]|uniref:glycosyltransferase family 2 protein n=1 Tax=Paenibacillus validus TaxID=44253 RepID=UPI000FDB15C1|nr:glycosyltransferase family A protein [Paenibacillus validus]MED4601270.1 glycosyltransferase family A protein [Paenibacillus validus]MED4605782.1 glycosyltransferase family A protein [Paenibacillus validus]